MWETVAGVCLTAALAAIGWLGLRVMNYGERLVRLETQFAAMAITLGEMKGDLKTILRAVDRKEAA
jgi:hypothetical protein